ncbi:Uncharacterised protein [Salmonella bongori]|nr:Uncharacterised protein [Salmonella bongori]
MILSDASLVFSVFAKNSLSDRAVNRANSFGYAFTQETGFVRHRAVPALRGNQ